MNHSFKYFDNIFVISAKSNAERRNYVEDIFTKLDVDFEFFDAIMGEELTHQEIEAVYDEERAKKHKTNKRPLSKPELGCALSHMQIYEKIIDDDLDNALIFEDDIVPHDEYLSDMYRAMKELPEDWDLIHFGTLNHFIKPPLSFKLKMIFYYPFANIFFPDKIAYQYHELWNLYPRNYSKTLNKAGYHLGCHAYAMSHSGAKKFLDYHDKIVTPVDNMLSVMFVEDRLNAYMTKNKVFAQNKDFESAIEDSRLLIRRQLQ